MVKSTVANYHTMRRERNRILTQWQHEKKITVILEGNRNSLAKQRDKEYSEMKLQCEDLHEQLSEEKATVTRLGSQNAELWKLLQEATHLNKLATSPQSANETPKQTSKETPQMDIVTDLTNLFVDSKSISQESESDHIPRASTAVEKRRRIRQEKAATANASADTDSSTSYYSPTTLDRPVRRDCNSEKHIASTGSNSVTASSADTSAIVMPKLSKRSNGKIAPY